MPLGSTPTLTKVAKPTAKNYTYDGKEHVGVAESEAYTLTGIVKAAEIGEI